MKVAKFGGSSLADAGQIQKVIEIINSDPQRKVIVVSAPGKRYPNDEKITDLLYVWQKNASRDLPYQEYMDKVRIRFAEIVQDLKVELDIVKEILQIEYVINSLNGTAAYAASRGEHLCGLIVAQALGYKYIYPESCIHFTHSGKYIQKDDLIHRCISNQDCVVPGFYGAVEHDSTNIRTFTRGGSDLTGAILARALNADIYENWTDVSGLLMCDPRIVSNPLPIKEVTYGELRELSYMGANVFHEEAMFPVYEAKIATNIRNTNDPQHPGTMIYPNRSIEQSRVITGIAGRGGFCVLTVTKMLMNKEIGFARKILSVLEDQGISFEHMPGGVDTLSIIIDQQALGDKVDLVISKINHAVKPDTIKLSEHMAMIAVVGRSMASSPGIAARIFSAVAKQNINIRMINQGSSELNIIIGVEEKDREKAIRAIYESMT